MSSRCAVMERYSPAAMENEPATNPAMPGQAHDRPSRIGARHAQHQRDVGDQPVTDPEDGRPGAPAPQVTVVVDCGCVVLVRGAHQGQRSEAPPRG